MTQRFPKDRSTPLPRNAVAVAIECPACHGTHAKWVLMRRVRRHIEQLRTPVRITLRTACPTCRAPLSARVRVDMSGRITLPARAERL